MGYDTKVHETAHPETALFLRSGHNGNCWFDMRVLDYIGSHIFLNFSFSEMGEAILKHE
jgi:hypothetical protein